jgi:hypothetical protein
MKTLNILNAFFKKVIKFFLFFKSGIFRESFKNFDDLGKFILKKGQFF